MDKESVFEDWYENGVPEAIIEAYLEHISDPDNLLPNKDWREISVPVVDGTIRNVKVQILKEHAERSNTVIQQFLYEKLYRDIYVNPGTYRGLRNLKDDYFTEMAKVVTEVIPYGNFCKQWRDMTRGDIQAVIDYLSANPDLNNLSHNRYHRLKKLRWNLKANKASQTGDARIINAYSEITNTIYLFACYSKNMSGLKNDDLPDKTYKKYLNLLADIERGN
jgi:hypothetical protein